MKFEPLNSKQLKRLLKTFGIEIKDSQIKHLKNGDVLLKKVNTKTGEEIIYVYSEIFFKKYNLKYSTHHKIKSGNELLISNFPLPNFTKKYK